MMRIICVAVLCAVLCACTSADHGTAEEMMAGWASNSSGTGSSAVQSSSVLALSTGVTSSSSIAVATGGTSSSTITASVFVDTRDNKSYKTVAIGAQEWLAENMNYSTSSGSWCFGDVVANCATYGRLYDWVTASTVCPTSWHLPDTTEWNTLSTMAGGASVAAKKLKSLSNSGSDDFGFAALWGGLRDGIRYRDVDTVGYWWTKTAQGKYYDARAMDGTGVQNLVIPGSYDFSVRCVRPVSSSSSVTASPSSSASCTNTYGVNSVTDCRDSTNYKTVVIGTQTWMAQNLNFTSTTGSLCYNGVATNCNTYGRLYDYATSLTACPCGWHLPDTTAWNILEAAVGGTATAGTKLKANSTLWNTNTGTDDFGFSALPGGNYNGTTGGNVGYDGYWWTAAPYGSSGAYSRYMYYTSANVYHGDFIQSLGLSVRCLMD